MKQISKRPLLEAPELTGWQYARAHSEKVSEFFQQIIEESSLDTKKFALIAVGSYGRRELCPYSDIDVLLLHDDDLDAREAAEVLWYPLWDRGLKIGYSVVTLKQAEQLVMEEFQWATAFLDSRLVLGQEHLYSELKVITKNLWAVHREGLMSKLALSVQERKERYGSVASHIEPNLKQGRGGLRDIHTLSWASIAWPGFSEGYIAEIALDIETVLKARIELHRLAGRPGDALIFDAQDEVAKVLGAASPKSFMMELAKAGRRIAWYSDEAWDRWTRSRRDLNAAQLLSISLPEIEEYEIFQSSGNFIRIKPSVNIADHPYAVLKFARLAAELDQMMDREALEILKQECRILSGPWTDEARADFVALFLAGRPAIDVIEDLDHFAIFEQILPEWEAVRCQPQRNVLHRFTVDRHLCETAVKAGEFADRVSRPDLLIVGAFLHDIGKGYIGDHTEVGVKLVAEIGDRMGFSDDDVSILVDLCQYHLLLADVATRRDLSDPGTIASVAAAVENIEFLELLSALTEADSISTGPSAWGSWKAGLMRELVERTKLVLQGEEPEDAAMSSFPPEHIQKLMDAKEWACIGDGPRLTVVATDVTNLFGIISGVLAAKGLQVLRAISSTEIFWDVARERNSFVIACRFTVQEPSYESVDWDAVEVFAKSAVEGRVALQARVSLRRQKLLKRRKRLAAEPPRCEVRFDNDTSDLATIVEVHSPATLGLLYQVIHSFLELRIEIRSSRVQTFGPQRVNSFYICDLDGYKVHDVDLLDEIKVAIEQVLENA